MQTLCEYRKGVYESPDLVFCSSLALYALAEKKPHPGEPNYAELACLRINGVEGVLLCLSPIDAMIQRLKYSADGQKYEVCPYEVADPRIFIRHHDNWLSLHIVYGYGAHNNKVLLDTGGYPCGQIFALHYQFSPENIDSHFCLNIQEEITSKLNKLHRLAGLPDYWSLVHEQAQSSMPELDVLASTALRVADYIEIDKVQESTQCALYDPVEAKWRFVGFDAL